MIIGICGKSGSGKSTLSRKIIELSSKNVVHLDIDEIGHKVLLLEEVKKEIINSFGTTLLEDDIVDRKKLGEIVFASRNEMNILSDITWKYMQIEIDNFINQNKKKIIILDWILLPITKYFKMCDIKILLDIPYELRKKRALIRDNISSNAFNLREKASIEFNHKDFDYIINSNNNEIIKRMVKMI